MIQHPSVSLLRRQFARFVSLKVKGKSSSSRKWLERQSSDPFTKEAHAKALKSRAAFKLLQIHEKFNIFRPGQNVVDLGFAPGAWSQVAADKVTSRGNILGIDILACEPPKGVSSMQANILSKTTHEMIKTHFYQLNMDKDLRKLQEIEPIADGPSYFQAEVDDNLEISNKQKQQFPVDVVMSDMCEPFFQSSGFGSAITNKPFHRMANTTGMAFKDHLLSIDLCDAALILAIDILKVNGTFLCKFFQGKEDKLLEARLKKCFKVVQRYKPPASRKESKENYFICFQKLPNLDKIQVFS
ncbi:2' O-ribose methyltransferase [Komagataella phaffii CBS 7435]|uniref:rRNA methyltransferase 2, mitochondrial n=2 Tax=Komagataella phaffii TaxID=460519 RepID=C4QWC4_KOMPG|nr:Mitochondrial 2' O-ribose methyltransferase, required for methylation of U(2791) in 21S rRNA [Komagataella phaffii GS115]AOA61570.1 GQ67_02761T0 [Komagataella phaffii]CAH2446217.1 2' O-ribose methyltransferase [Komagataella phaffii CBS 7435]AOA66684.1 GQ68_02487T0 [Komagataella phaffii GS115]CAY67547.1 Mitochondrial 2' O-ribose methyltransferase, required for methylation of U(2791) in 21S rRNA [Komagataella phaffii GS115]CCA36643.1 2' O-ribose methyltransferase [Komagataella phaffii CBS 743